MKKGRGEILEGPSAEFSEPELSLNLNVSNPHSTMPV